MIKPITGSTHRLASASMGLFCAESISAPSVLMLLEVVFRRGDLWAIFPWVFLWFSYGFPMGFHDTLW